MYAKLLLKMLFNNIYQHNANKTMTSKNIVFQSFMWDYEKYKDPLTHHQEIWAVGKFAEETSEKTSTSNTCLVRIKDYPYKVDLEIKNKNYQPLMNNFQDWMFRNSRAQRKYFPEEAEVMSGMKSYQKRYEHYKETMSHTEPLAITVDENRRTIYHFKPIKFENGKYVEDTICQMTLSFANKDIAKMFVVGHLKMSFSNRNGKYTTFKLYEEEFEIRLLNFGVTPIVRLLNEIGCKRCQWIKAANPETVKPAARLCNQEFISNYRTYEGVDKSERIYTSEFCVSWKDLSPHQGSNYISIPRLLSFDLECYSDNHKAIPNPWSLKHKITGISAVFQIGNDRSSRTRKAFVIPRCRTDKPTEGDGKTNAIVVCKSEYDMLNQFFEFVRVMDPDILIGYNIFGFDIPYMDTRLVRSMKSWGDMSRIKNDPTTLGMANWASSAYGKNVLCWLETTGRFCVDMMVVIQRDYKFNDYKLETVSQALLNKGKNDVSAIEMFEIFEHCLQNKPGCDDEMLRVMEYCLQDSVLPTELFEKINGWAFLIESANVMNVNPIELFTRGQQLRLMNQYYDKCAGMGYSIDRRKANVILAEGALVVDPVKGVHNDIMVFDFASLYPSIIIAYNISHDTLVLDDKIPDEHCHVFKWKDSDDIAQAKEIGAEVETIKETLQDLIGDALQEENDERDPDVTHRISKTEDGYWKFRFIKPEYGHKGIACVTLEDLLAERKRVRKEQGQTKDSVLWSILEERQKAVKVSCNSIYGMLLAQSTGKLALAEGGVCTTAKGRELNLLMQTIIKDEFMGKTIYGDSVTGDTPVLVRDPVHGMRYENIADLGLDWKDGYHNDKESSTVADGLEVWSDDGFVKVENLIRHKCNKKILRVLTHTGCVDVTEDHSLLDTAKNMVKPSEVKVGDSLLHCELPIIDETPSDISEDTAYALGLFLAEGSCGSYYCKSSGWKHSWAISNADVKVFDRATKGLCEKYPKYSFKILDTLSSSGAYKLVACCNKEYGAIKELVEEHRAMFYDNNKQKKIPNFIYSSPRIIRQAFWDGYYAGDGDQDKNGYVRCDCKGKIGSAGLYWLASSLGYPVSLNTRKDKETIYRMTCSRKKQRKDPNQIKKIIDLGYTDDYVYDFTTGNHHFSAGVGRMVVHNTDSVMIYSALILKIAEHAQTLISKGMEFPSTDWKQDYLLLKSMINDSNPEIKDSFIQKFAEPFLRMTSLAKFAKQDKPYISIKETIELNKEYEIAEHIDEDVLSHMLTWEHCGVASDILLCTMMGNIISESISERLPKPIKLEFENIFHTALYMMKKRYACIKIDAKSKKPIMNKKKIYSKGIMLARRDQCAWAKETFENTLWDDLLRKDIRVLAVEVAEKMLAPLRWQYPLQSFAVTQKLGYDYANDTYPLKLFAEHLEDIGKPARANDRVQYVVTKAPHLSGDVKLGQKFRLIETLRDEMANNTNAIDHMYYVDRLKNDMDQILSVGYMDQIARCNEERRVKRIEMLKAKIESLQTQIDKLQEETHNLQEKVDKKNKKEIAELMRNNKREITGLTKTMEESSKTLSKLETGGDQKSEVPKKLKGIYKGIIKLHLDEEIFKHQLRLIQHYSESVVSEIKSLNTPVEERENIFDKKWLVENDCPRIVKTNVVEMAREEKTDNQRKLTAFFQVKL